MGNKDADSLTCLERIEWLKEYEGISENEACTQVASAEFSEICGKCNPESCTNADNSQPRENEKEMSDLTCGCPDTCTSNTLDFDADGYSCKDRIKWLMVVEGNTELEACNQVGGVEFRNKCAFCDPDRCLPSTTEKTDEDGDCAPCSKDICSGALNRCPV